MDFGEAFEQVKQGKGMRLPQWESDVIVRVQHPDEINKISIFQLYIESRFGKISESDASIKMFFIEIFSEDWEVVK